MAPLHRSSPPQIQAQPQPQPQPHQQLLQIQHFTHQHPLHKLFMGSQFNCDGCKTAGYGLRYRCDACDFDLHEQCATSPHSISSHLHPHHLLLVNRPGNSHFCDVCKGFADGLSYTCHSQTCEFDVHPPCTQIPVAAGIPSAGFNNQPAVMINKQQQQQGVATTVFGGYNNQPVMMMNQQQQQQMALGGYNGVNNNQPVMMINQQYQQFQQQQQQGMGFGGFNNQPQPVMMMNQQPQGRTSSYSNVGKLAANILMTSLIGVPLNFNSKN